MRYFARIQYNGSTFSGWQKQPNAPTIQEELENRLSQVLRSEIPIVGCGRTDAGVHASDYYFHFDIDKAIPLDFNRKINGIIHSSIVVKSFVQVNDEAHARFDAYERSYTYYLTRDRDPFRQDTATHYPFFDKLDFELMNVAAALLLDYEDFYTFCKSNTDVKTYLCDLKISEWRKSNDSEWTYHITANRFLRGMVRLIVGMCLRVGSGKLSIDDVKEALDSKSRMDQALSAPPQGLFLSKISYPYL